MRKLLCLHALGLALAGGAAPARADLLTEAQLNAAQKLYDFRDVEGELEGSLGLTRELSRHWSLGIEARDHNELPDYSQWENTAVYVGPVVSYRNEKWWATLTVMPQVYGANFLGNPDANIHLDLEGHERWNIRLIAGISF